MQRKQYLVQLSEAKGNRFIKFLENEGFLNVHNIDFEDLKLKVLVVDDKKFFGTNVTCLAVLSSKNIRPISIEKFVAEYKANINTDYTI